MAVCKDCIHYDICCLWSTTDLDNDKAYEYCYDRFKDKKDFVRVKHGKWLITDTFDSHYQTIYKCSECWKDVADDYINHHKYCLHCGAKMDAN